MKRLRWAIVPCTLMLLIAALVVRAHAVGAAPAQTCGSWSLVSSPDPGQYVSELDAVATISSNNVWAVGDYINSNGVNQTLTMRWNGISWSVITIPSPGSIQNGLLGVKRIPGTKQLWAVGFYTNQSTPERLDQTLIELWNGKQWQVVPSPSPSAGSNDLFAVDATSATDAWAVGTYTDSNDFNAKTLFEHWNGSSWSVVSSPNPNTQELWVNAVTALSSNNVWVAGYYDSGSGSQTLIEHWNGSSWSIVSSPNPGSEDNTLYGITSVPNTNHVWAVGYYNSSGPSSVLTEFWNGKKWKVISGANPAPELNVLNGITSFAPNNTWAVGYSLGYGNSYEQTLIEHWNGSSWSVVSSPNEGQYNNDLESVARIPGTTQVWAVGPYFNNGLESTLTESYC